jgi:hypothetical protein
MAKTNERRSHLNRCKQTFCSKVIDSYLVISVNVTFGPVLGDDGQYPVPRQNEIAAQSSHSENFHKLKAEGSIASLVKPYSCLCPIDPCETPEAIPPILFV